MNRSIPLIMLCLFLTIFAAGTACASPRPTPTMPPLMQDADDTLALYYNPDGGRRYHLDPNCATVHHAYLPLAGSFLYGQLAEEPYAALVNCAYCAAPLRPEAAQATPTAAPTPVCWVSSQQTRPVLCVSPTPVPVWVDGQPTAGYQRETPIDMPAGEDYLPMDIGVTTWRGDSFRSNAASGTLESAPTTLKAAWTATFDAGDAVMHGFNFHSQPVIVQWPKDLRTVMNLTEAAQSTAALCEVILPSLDGRIRFLNLADGSITREAINVGYPLSGTATLHPQAYPLLLTGQTANELPYGSGSIGLHFHELLTQRSVRFIDGTMPGMDDQALYGAFTTAALIDRSSDTAVALSWNGYLYTEALNQRLYSDEAGNLVYYQSGFDGPMIRKVIDYGYVASAPVMYGSRLWFGTRSGTVVCVDTTTMERQWTTQITGDVYALAMEQEEDRQLWLYAGTSWSSYASKRGCRIVRINADTGETDWQLDLPLSGSSGGAYASPVIGKDALGGMVFFAISDPESSTGSTVLALDKQTGEVLWTQRFMKASTASPVAVYDAEGNGWIIAAESDEKHTRLYLLDGLTGKVVSTLALEGGSPSSPAVRGDMLVIGVTTENGAAVYGVRIASEAALPVPALCTTAPQAGSAESAAWLSKLNDFLQAWAANDLDAMLALCPPSWKEAQTKPAATLFQLVANRTAVLWAAEIDQAEDGILVCPVTVQINRNNGREPAWYLLHLRVVEEDGLYWVDPDGLATATACDAPSVSLAYPVGDELMQLMNDVTPTATPAPGC